MRNLFLTLFILAGLLTAPAPRGVLAQDPAKGTDVIINETLDSLENRLDRLQASLEEEAPETFSPKKIFIPAGETPPEAPRIPEQTPAPAGNITSGKIAAVPDKEAPAAVGLETKIIPLVYAEASGILETLQDMKGPKGEVSYDSAESALILTDTPERVAAMNAYIVKIDILLETEVFELEFIRTDEGLSVARQAVTEGIGQAEAGEKADSIIVTDTPAALGKIRELLKEKDRFNRAIRIKTRVLQIVLNEEHVAGVDWEAIVSEYQGAPFPGLTGAGDGANGGTLSLGVVTKEDYAVLLEALDTVGAVETVDEGTMITEQGKGKTVKVLSAAARGEGDAPSGAGQIHFDVTPLVKKDGTRTVSVTPRLVGGNPGHTIYEGKTEAAVRIKNEETIVVGGLFEEVLVESAWKIPLLGDLPLLGFVFRNEGEVPRRSEIILFLTVTVTDRK